LIRLRGDHRRHFLQVTNASLRVNCNRVPSGLPLAPEPNVAVDSFVRPTAIWVRLAEEPRLRRARQRLHADRCQTKMGCRHMEGRAVGVNASCPVDRAEDLGNTTLGLYARDGVKLGVLIENRQ